MNIDNLCMSCMNELYGEKQCPKCNYYVDSPQISPYLPLRTPIGDKYIIGKVLSSNSEGATYMAYDVERRTPVTIREFLPERFVDRNFGSTELTIKEQWREYYYAYLGRFLNLWRSLARVRGLSAVIPVIDIVEENNTAYAVTEYFESITLREFLLKSQTGYLNWEKAKVLFMPVLTTLSALHRAGIFHFGINPDNLLIGRDGKLRLSGFSINEARLEGSELTPEHFEGYTPLEQYSFTFNEGSWSDVYSFCAVVYRALVGSVPQDSVSRSANDQLIIPARYAEIIPVYVINALMNGLQLDPQERTRDVEMLREELSATPSNVVSSFSGVNVPTNEVKRPLPPIEQPKQEETDNKKTILIAFLAILGVGLILFGGFLVYDRFIKDMGEEEISETEPVVMVEVPNFVNTSFNMLSQNTVQNQRFTIKSVMEYSSTVEEGYIISQSIEPGESVAQGTEITFVVSRGPEYVTVPKDIKDLREDFAIAKLEELGFVVEVIKMENDGTHTEGEIIEITPGPGESKEKGSKVYLQVWDAPPEELTETTTEKNPWGLF